MSFEIIFKTLEKIMKKKLKSFEGIKKKFYLFKKKYENKVYINLRHFKII